LPIEADIKHLTNSFGKFVGCKEFEEGFKKLFNKNKNKKNFVIFDTEKHSLFGS
jgi:hypothetical protein